MYKNIRPQLKLIIVIYLSATEKNPVSLTERQK